MNVNKIINFQENTINSLHIQQTTSTNATPAPSKPKNIIYQVLEPIVSFTGRLPQIQAIHENLQANATYVVTGLGGVGKTELLRTYAKTHQSCYDHIIWISCETKVDVKKSFTELATELAIETVKFKTERNLDIIISDVYNVLSGEKTLMIFDNVISFKEISSCMPRITTAECNTFYCLLSSQNTEWGGSIGTMPLNVLTLQEARNLMNNNLPEGSYDSAQEIEQLVQTLQFLPLALQQAIAYITDKRNYVSGVYKIRDYLKEFGMEEALLNHKFPGGFVFPDYSDQKYDKTIFINIQMMLNKVRENSDNNNNAENIIFICSYFSPDFINKTIFYPLINKTKTDDALRILSKYSCITINFQWIFIHRLVQKVLRFIIKNDDNLEYEIQMKALTLSAQDLLLFKTHLCSVLRFVEKKPKLYLDFYENYIMEEKVQFVHFIAHNNFFAILKTIINTDVNYDIQKDNLCFHVVFSDNIDMMIFVHMKGADVNMKDMFETSPLHVAVLRNNFRMVDCLVRLGADLHTNNVFCFTPFYFGLALNHRTIIEYLVRRAGYNLNNKTAILNETSNEMTWTPLIFAATFCELETVQLLVKLGADVNYRIDSFENASSAALDRDDTGIFKYLWCLQDKQDIFPDTSLHKACGLEQLDVVVFLLEHDFDVNTRNFNEDTALMEAIQTQNIEIVQTLIENGADTTLSNMKGEFPLLVAVTSKNIHLVQYLLQTNCDINQQRNDGLTSLDVAILEGNEEMTKLLLDNSAIINRDHKDALFYSILKGNLTILKYLIDHKVDLSKTYARSKTERYSILHLSSEFGHLNIVQYLRNFFSIGSKTHLGNTVLHIACNFGHFAIVEEIIDSFVDIDDVNQEFETPLHLAVTKGHFNITKYLIEKGSNVNKTNKYNDTPLMLASKHNHLNIVKFLLQNKANLKARNKNKDTALHLSVAGSNTDIVKYLLENDAQINTGNKDGQAPIHLASFYGYFEILEDLYNAKANINIQNFNGNTPLHLAVLGGHLNIVLFLLEKGAKLNIKNKNDFIPIQLAKTRKLNQIVDVLNTVTKYDFYLSPTFVGITLLIIFCYIKYKL